MKNQQTVKINRRVGIIIAAIWTVVLVMSFSVAVYANDTNADTEPEIIRLGYFDFQNYMQGAAEDLPKTGYAYDLLQDVATINNWKYEYVYGDFNDLYPMLLSGEIDVLPCLVYTDERSKNHLFADEEIYIEQYYISTLSERAESVLSVRDLDGKSISTVTDCYQNVVFEEWEKQNDISMNIIYTNSFDNSWEMVRNGTADYILNIDSAFNGSGFTSLFEVGHGSSRFAIAPGREDIRKKMNAAFNTIYEINPFTVSHLKEQYLSATLSSYHLSEDEIEWINGKDSITIAGFEDDAPYSYRDADENVTGIYPDVVSLMLKKLNVDLDVTWILYDNEEEMYNALLSGEVDLICPFYADSYYAETRGLAVSEELQKINMGLMYGDRTAEKDIKRIAIPNTDIIRLFVQEYYPSKELVICDNLEDCMDKLNSNDADAVVAHITALQNLSMDNTGIFNIKTLVSDCPICFASNSKDGKLICIIDRGIHLISDSDFQELELNHSPKRNYELWNYIKNNKLVFGAILLAVITVFMFAIGMFVASKRLKKNLKEITEQKRVIEENEQKLIEAEAAANSANKAKSIFLFNMSHDIRTPMNAILGYSNRMIKHIDDKELVNESANKIISSGEYLLALINDVLDMARIESDQVRIEETIADIRERAIKLCDVFEVNMQNKNLTFNVDFSDMKDTVIWYDSHKVRQIVLNLISNSVKYTEEGGTITHTLRQLPCEREGYGRYEIKVCDTGIGMTPEFVERIFEQFSRSDDSITKQTQGTGLGMSIVKQLVDLMDGTIDIDSEVGRGTDITVVFDFRLPSEEELEEYRTKQEPAPIPKIPANLKILVVDDNSINREILQGILKDEGCIIAGVAENGQMAVDKVAASSPGDFELILMDVQMPVMDGYEATRRIRALENEKLANIPIIALTANAFEEDRKNALASGMNNHVSKPVDIEKLRSALADIS